MYTSAAMCVNNMKQSVVYIDQSMVLYIRGANKLHLKKEEKRGKEKRHPLAVVC